MAQVLVAPADVRCEAVMETGHDRGKQCRHRGEHEPEFGRRLCFVHRHKARDGILVCVGELDP